jgi:hypothetical protein
MPINMYRPPPTRVQQLVRDKIAAMLDEDLGASGPITQACLGLVEHDAEAAEVRRELVLVAERLRGVIG